MGSSASCASPEVSCLLWKAVFLSAVFLLVCAGHRLQDLPLWVDEAEGQGLLVFHLSQIIHYGREVEDMQSKLSCNCNIE